MYMYAVIRVGVYDQGIFSVSDNLDKSIDYAKELYKNDCDNYHNYEVVRFTNSLFVSISEIKEDAALHWKNYKNERDIVFNARDGANNG